MKINENSYLHVNNMLFTTSKQHEPQFPARGQCCTVTGVKNFSEGNHKK